MMKHGGAAQLAARVAALEQERSDAAAAFEQAAANQRRALLHRVLRRTVILRSVLVAKGLVDLPESREIEEKPEKERCWADTPGATPEAVDDDTLGDDETLFDKARERCDWVERYT